MDRDTFEDHLDRYGADLASWPEASQGDAAALLHRSPETAAALRAVREIEAFFVETAPKSQASVDAVAAAASRHRQITSQTASTRRLVVGTGWGVAAAIMLFFGYTVGDIAQSPHDESPDRVMASALDTPGVYDVD